MNQHPPFFIVGLPRSRTAWLANLLTYGPAFCLHDGLKRCEAPADLAKRFELTGAQFPGDADPTLPLFYPQIHALFPQARYVFVDRDVSDARRSYDFAVGDRQPAAEIDASFERLRAALCAMRTALRNQHTLGVRYADLDQYHTVAAIWEYCVPGVAFHPLRWELLEELRVTVIADKAAKRLDRERLGQLVSHMRPLGAAALPVKGSELTPLKQRYVALLGELCAGNRAAYDWLVTWLNLTLTWDHIADNDPIDKQVADWSFEAALLDWPLNPFWQQHGAALRPVIAATITAWRKSDTVNADPFKGWDVYTEVPLAVALLLGGREHMNRWNLPVRDLVWDIYREHGKETA